MATAKTQLLAVFSDLPSIARASAEQPPKRSCYSCFRISRVSLKHRPSSRQNAATRRVFGSPEYRSSSGQASRQHAAIGGVFGSPEHHSSIGRAAAKTQLLGVFSDLPSIAQASAEQPPKRSY